MTSLPPRSVPVAVQPIYPYNQPGEAIPIYAGTIGFQDQEIPGVIELRCSPSLDLAWRVTAPITSFAGPVELQVPLFCGDVVMAGHQRWIDHGWLDETELATAQGAQLSRLVAHWMNLPGLRDALLIREPGDADDRLSLRRWVHTTGGWQLTIDARPDLDEVYAAIGEDRAIAITHVMELRRDDGQDFSITEAKQVLTALQYGLSLGLGRWVPPALPVGFDAAGNRVWEHWASDFCDAGTNGTTGKWLNFNQSADVRDLIDKAIAAFVDDWAREHEWVPLLAMAVQGNKVGRVEQRIMTLHAGLEMLGWVTLRHDYGWTKTQYNKITSATAGLRLLLAAFGLSTEIDPVHLSALHSFALDQLPKAEGPADGPFVVNRIRNRIIHPEPYPPASPDEETTERLREAALFDSFLLSQEYYILLLLRRLNYAGEYRSPIRTKPEAPVPWA